MGWISEWGEVLSSLTLLIYGRWCFLKNGESLLGGGMGDPGKPEASRVLKETRLASWGCSCHGPVGACKQMQKVHFCLYLNYNIGFYLCCTLLSYFQGLPIFPLKNSVGPHIHFGFVLHLNCICVVHICFIFVRTCRSPSGCNYLEC